MCSPVASTQRSLVGLHLPYFLSSLHLFPLALPVALISLFTIPAPPRTSSLTLVSPGALPPVQRLPATSLCFRPLSSGCRHVAALRPHGSLPAAPSGQTRPPVASPLFAFRFTCPLMGNILHPAFPSPPNAFSLIILISHVDWDFSVAALLRASCFALSHPPS